MGKWLVGWTSTNERNITRDVRDQVDTLLLSTGSASTKKIHPQLSEHLSALRISSGMLEKVLQKKRKLGLGDLVLIPPIQIWAKLSPVAEIVIPESGSRRIKTPQML